MKHGLRNLAYCAFLLGLGGMVLDARAQTVAILDEQAHIDVIKGDADWNKKQEACRALRQVGTEKSVPALAALLGDEQLSHWARYALEPMPCAAAGTALREAVSKLQGAPRLGAIISLGVRRDAEAIPLLDPLLRDSDPATAQAAAGALGRIATPQAAQTLMGFGTAAPGTLRPALGEALLAAAERLDPEGQATLAARIHQTLLGSDWPMQVRTGAFRGYVYDEPKETVQRVIEAIRKPEMPIFQGMAAQIVAETSGADATRVYADALATLPVEAQVALLRGLAGRGDLAARTQVAQAANHADKAVKCAAIQALAVLGSAEDVPALTALMASEDTDIAQDAQASLSAIESDGVDAAIATAIPAASPAVQAQLLASLTERRAPQALPKAVEGLGAQEAPVRLASLETLSVLGNKEHAAAVIAAFEQAKEDAERGAAEDALGALCTRFGEELLPAVIEKMSGGPLEMRTAMLRTLAKIRGAKALEQVVAALKDSDMAFRNEALRELSDWPTADAAPQLLELAKSPEENLHVLGLRGYTRLARNEADGGAKINMLTAAMALTRKPEEKWAVLAAWGTLIAPQSLDAVQPLLADPAVRDEAASALIAVAAKLDPANAEHKPRALAALKAVVETCSDGPIKDKAKKTMERFEK